MADIQTFVPAQAPKLPPIGVAEEELVVEQEKISPRLTAYIKLLSDRETFFHIDAKVSRHRVVQELEPRWPKHPGWEAEARAVLKSIDEAVKSMPASGPTSAILLRMTFGSRPFLPAALAEPDESVAVVAFDSVTATKRQCSVQAQVKSEPSTVGFKDMGVKAGLIIVSQPILRIANQFSDSRMYAYGNGANLYSDRRHDLPFEKIKSEPPFMPVPAAWLPNPHATAESKMEHNARGLDADIITEEEAVAELGENEAAEPVVGGGAEQGAAREAAEAPEPAEHSKEETALESRSDEENQPEARETGAENNEEARESEGEIAESETLGREAAAAENEITGGSAAETEAEAFPSEPHRPESAEVEPAEAEAAEAELAEAEPAEAEPDETPEAAEETATSPEAGAAETASEAAEAEPGVEAAEAPEAAEALEQGESEIREPETREPETSEPEAAEPAEAGEQGNEPAGREAESGEPEGRETAEAAEETAEPPEERAFEEAREEMRLPAVEAREGEFSPEATQERSAEQARETEHENNASEFEKEQEADREDANGMGGAEPRENEAGGASENRERAETAEVPGAGGERESRGEQEHREQERNEHEHNEPEHNEQEHKEESREENPLEEKLKEEAKEKAEEPRGRGEASRGNEGARESREGQAEERTAGEGRGAEQRPEAREGEPRPEAAYERAERMEREDRLEPGVRGEREGHAERQTAESRAHVAREDHNQGHNQKGHFQEAAERRAENNSARDGSHRDAQPRESHEQVGSRREAAEGRKDFAPESLRHKDGFQDAVYRGPEKSSARDSAPNSAHNSAHDSARDTQAKAHPGNDADILDRATVAARDIKRKGLGDWGFVRAAAARLPDSLLATFASLGSPAAREAYQYRMAQRHAKEATEEDRNRMKEAMHEERKREAAVAQAQHTKMENKIVKPPGLKPDDLTLDA